MPRSPTPRANRPVPAIGCAALAALLALGPAPSAAFVLGGTVLEQTGQGAFVKLPTDPGFAVGADTFNTDHLYAFDEDQNITLPRAIAVEIAGVGFAEGSGVGRGAGAIPAGTVVASHYVFFDSIAGIQVGHVDFDAPILGVAVSQRTMAATDFLANTAVTYLNPELRGLEAGDMVWVEPEDRHRLWVAWAGSSPGDYIRVFTARSPAGV
ncbi:MAG: hypothetical protein AAGC57_06165 [Pseudomonadota bacterium]